MLHKMIVRASGIALAAALAATVAFAAPAPAAAAPAAPQAALAQQAQAKPRAARMLVAALVRATVEATGQDAPAVRQALVGGQSLAQFAAANGSSGDEVVQAVVAKARERIDKAVARGRITSERAETLIDKLTTRATELVNDTGLGAKIAARRP